MRGDLLQEKTGSAMKRGMGKLAALFPRSRRGYAVAIVLAFAAIIVTAALSYRAIDRELTDVALSRRVAVAQLAAATLSEKFGRITDVAISLATRVRFREVVAEAKWAEASEILRTVPHDFPLVERLFLTDVEGTLMADVPELPGMRGMNFSGRDWYQGVRRDWRPYVSAVYKRTAAPQLNVFAVAVPIRDAAGGVSGILVLQVRPEVLFEWVREIEIEPEGFFYIIDSKEQIAFHSKHPGAQEITNLSETSIVRKLRGSKDSVEIGFDPVLREDSISAHADVPGHGWGVVTQQPVRASLGLAARDHQLKLLLATYGIVLLLSIAAIYSVARIAIQRTQAEEDRRMKAELERLVAERTAQLETSNKELESFSYSISHDLRSPLRAIGGFSRILTEDYGDKLDDEGRRLLGVVRDNSQKMGELIDDLLEFSRLGRKPLSTAEINTKRLVEEVYGELQAGSEQRARLALGTLPPAYGDPVLIKQAWVNLLGNAIKFSGKREQPVIEVSGRENGRENVYCVKDNGAGFDMRYYDKLFGVFQRLHSTEEFEGTGVGLAIVQRVVSRHGGRVWAEGKVNEGAKFCFSLPNGGVDGQI